MNQPPARSTKLYYDSLNELPILLSKTTKPIRTWVAQQGISGTLGFRERDSIFIPANADATASGMVSGADPHDPRFAAAIIRQPVLFDLAKDPNETKNLAAQFVQKVKEPFALLEETGAMSTSTKKNN